MTSTTAFWITCGLYGVAVIGSLLGDGVRRGRVGSAVAAFSLLCGGGVALFSAWTSEPTFVAGTFYSGAGFSLIPGLAGVLSGLSIAAEVPSGDPRFAQRSALVSLAALGATLVAQAGDVVTLVLSLEIAAAASYALVAFARSRRSYESAVKYFIQGSVATALILVAAAALAAGSAPSLGYAVISRAAGTAPTTALTAGIVLLVAGLAFKAGAAPFHSWAPDAYEVAPPAAGGVLAGVVKAAVIAALCVVLGASAFAGSSPSLPLGLLGTAVFPIVATIGGLSIVVGSVGALRQRSYLRMLGYAGVAQVGFALLALGARSLNSTLVAIATYAVATTGAFLFARWVELTDDSWDGSVGGLTGTVRRSPLAAASISLLMMSMAGIPPFLGFWGKFQVFQSTIASSIGLTSQGFTGLGLFYASLTLIGVVGAIVSVGYYGAVIAAVYSSVAGEEGQPAQNSGLTLLVVLLLGCASLLLGVVPLLLPAADVIRGFVM